MASQDETTIPSAATTTDQTAWERELLARLAFAGLQEQRRARRWGIFFKFLAFLYIGVIGFIVLDLPALNEADKTHAALIKVHGLIAEDVEASAENINKALRAAFKDDGTTGVILDMNTPGGSPVQSAYINAEMLRLREKYPDIPLYAVVSDVCASGGYYIAVAADKIYAHPASIVGSIGVRFDSFGFVEAIDKLGIDRRLLTAGKYKALLDPFKPVVEDEEQHVQTLLDQIHAQFITAVKQRRAEQLADEPDIFSGLFWSGEQALELGLVDDFASVGDITRDVLKTDRIVDFTLEEDWVARLAKQVGTALSTVLREVVGDTTTQLR